MKIKYHQQRNNKRRISQILLSVTVLSLLILILTLTGKLQITTKYVYASVLSGVDNLKNTLEVAQSTLTPKSTLLKENQEMREHLQKLQTISTYNKALEQENQNLRALLNTRIGSKTSNKSVKKPATYLARIIDYKNAPYGTILAKIATPGAKVGDLAVFGKMIVGDIVEVNGNYILIKLITASDRVSEVNINNNIAIFTGDSNNTGTITLSRTIPIQIGDIVTLPQANGLIIGTVEDIDKDSQDSMQTIRVKALIPISQLHFISIIND